jgi:hypothetical protein
MLGFYILEDECIKFLPWFLSACFVRWPYIPAKQSPVTSRILHTYNANILIIINVGVWTGLDWLRTETGGGQL